VVKGVAYVNLRTQARVALPDASTSCGRDQFFAQVESTVKKFSGVKSVVFALDGKPSDFYEWFELECPSELGARCSGKNFG
jgi:Sporulation and spore germination